MSDVEGVSIGAGIGVNQVGLSGVGFGFDPLDFPFGLLAGGPCDLGALLAVAAGERDARAGDGGPRLDCLADGVVRVLGLDLVAGGRR